MSDIVSSTRLMSDIVSSTPEWETKRKQAEVVGNHEEQQLCSGTSTLLVQNCYYPEKERIIKPFYYALLPELLKYHVYCLCIFCFPQLLYIMWSLSMYNQEHMSHRRRV